MRIFLIVLAATLLLAGASTAQEHGSAGPRPYLEEAMAPTSPALSQGDSRWGWFRIGNSTIREQGCLVMVIAMVALDRGLITDPLWMFRQFVTNGLFTRSGLLVTSAIDRVLPGLRVLSRSALSASGLDRVRAELAQGRAVLIKLDRDLRRAGIQQHWVRATIYAGELVIDDPNGGKRDTLLAIYGSESVVREMLVLG